ncbi:hypothetical protein [Achromobacter xylosoxidans]|jgi:hypothetical protein|uniref:hypothetical protein n=1 Tax=Alcaligenes xylosoxydans xylosoxydans TaxID=85698 RepID=UPI0006C7269C|nr:hypothetical protein [Achromobacter xylosoxidans]MCM2573071.1 hypothetical protein [Achromobacter xylosoxidans]QQE55528.1 hypothetical protein I6H41_21675 [Achromobacter xylosoxidans]QQV15171.1 hypothetical protein I6I48_04615 [Achromobacter xylosoxidans]UXL05226.1 hypothetical protein N4T34_00410 [Achromobacter xylosoxidans]CUJ06286.1 Uncharacterised protein [Achromobacter xylosoxidans]
MVIKLSRPQIDDENLIEQIVLQRQNGRNRNYFSKIKDEWKQRVATYVADCGNPETIAPWPEALKFKKRFHTLYNSPQDGSAQKPILEKLRERTLQLCPACGEDGTPNTLDHYLPKNGFPDYSITAANLFPMCDICQGKKLEQALSNNNERLFLHPYFDTFLDQQVLQLEIGEPYTAPTSISLIAHQHLPIHLQQLVSRHIEKLGLIERYSHFFRQEYTRLLGLTEDILAGGLNVRQQLNLFCNQARRKSVNSWGHIFFESVLRNDDLLKHLETSYINIAISHETEEVR